MKLPSASFGRTSGYTVGDRTQGDQPTGSEVGIGITVVVQAPAMATASSTAAQDAAQAHPHPPFQPHGDVAHATAEVVAPAAQHAVEVGHDTPQGDAARASRPLADSFFELLLALLPWPAIATFKVPAEELEA